MIGREDWSKVKFYALMLLITEGTDCCLTANLLSGFIEFLVWTFFWEVGTSESRGLVASGIILKLGLIGLAIWRLD